MFLLKSVFGSRLYGTSTPQSDTDFKGLFLPTPEEILLGRTIKSKTFTTGDDSSRNTKDDIDTEYYSLHYFIELLIKGDTGAIDMLHTPIDQIEFHNRFGYDIWMYIYENRKRFYTSNMSAYVGYVMKQASKYGVKGSRLACVEEVINFCEGVISNEPTTKVAEVMSDLPVGEFSFISKDKLDKSCYEVLGRKFQPGILISDMLIALYKIRENYGERAIQAQSNQGIDWKALSHAVRVCLQMKEIYSTADLKYPLKDAETIKMIKSGSWSFDQFTEYLNVLLDEVQQASKDAKEKGLLKESVDVDFWENFVKKIHFQIITG